MTSLIDTIAGGMRRSHGLLERALLGTTDPAAIASHVGAWCATHLHTPVAAGIAYQPSVGLLVGVELADGRRVAVKAHHPTDAHRLRAVRDIQAMLADTGFPAPAPIGDPAPLVHGIAAAEIWLDGGVGPDGHADGDRSLFAHTLHDLVERARSSSTAANVATLDAPWPLRVANELWPPPHDLRLDFDATSAGAEWIDDIARAARATLATQGLDDTGDWVIGHHDWRAEHVRVDDDHRHVVAVYDWDSLRRSSEAACVGDAAWMLPADWTVEQQRPFCDADEIDDFIARYEDARGRGFTRPERGVAHATATYSLAYTARCVHSDRQLGAVAHGAWADALPDLVRGVAQRWSIGR